MIGCCEGYRRRRCCSHCRRRSRRSCSWGVVRRLKGHGALLWRCRAGGGGLWLEGRCGSLRCGLRNTLRRPCGGHLGGSGADMLCYLLRRHIALLHSKLPQVGYVPQSGHGPSQTRIHVLLYAHLGFDNSRRCGLWFHRLRRNIGARLVRPHRALTRRVVIGIGLIAHGAQSQVVPQIGLRGHGSVTNVQVKSSASALFVVWLPLLGSRRP